MSAEIGNHITDLLPAYVLDVLTDEELTQVVEHLAVCPMCQAEYNRLQVVADDLPLAVAQTPPPVKVKASLMAAIHRRQAVSLPSSPPSLGQKFVHWLRQPLPALGLVLILALVVGNVLLFHQLSLVNLEARSHMRVVGIANTEYSPSASGTLIMDANGKYGTLVVDNLATLDSVHQYQVWLVRGGVRVSGGVFSVNSEGYASLELSAPLPLIQYDSIGVTVEPSGGSTAPTGDKVLSGNIPR